MKIITADSRLLTTRLIAGSKNINRMREETKQAVQTLIGLLKKALGKKVPEWDDQPVTWAQPLKEQAYKSPDGTMLWRIFTGASSGDPVITCYRIRGKETAQIYSSIANTVTLQDTQAVFEGLPVLVQGMFQSFPILQNLCDPFIKASEVFSKEN